VFDSNGCNINRVEYAMFGFLGINKPPAMTSRSVVNVVQRLVKPHKVGHAGTLDPLATGVLIVAVGKATRLMQHVHALPKKYRGTFQLGMRSDTEDIEGKIQTVENVRQPSRHEIQAVVDDFQGTQSQQPPAFSALKIKGQRAYSLARQGKSVKLEPREITIHRIELIEYSFPFFTVDVQCSTGTYIRSLGRDIGVRLECGAIMTELERTAIGSLTVEQCSELDFEDVQSVQQTLRNPLELLDNVETMAVTTAQIDELGFGREIELNAQQCGPSASHEVFAVNTHGHLVAILSPAETDAFGMIRMRPIRVFDC
jgi:tRNA pseudouridine55 synthase